MHRRSFLTLVAASLSLSAGCLGNSHTLAPEDNWDLTTQTSTHAAGTVTLPSGTYGAYPLEPTTPVQVGIEIAADAPVDLFVLDEGEYDTRYRDGEELQYRSGLSAVATEATTTQAPLQPGRYVICIDNSNVYGASSEQEVTVEFAIRSQPR